jgi:predicted nucleic acid-binding protein
MDVESAQLYLDDVFQPMLVVEPSLPLFREALAIYPRYQLSWYDSLIVAAALRAQYAILSTEDLQHGQRFGERTIVNPFL